MPRAKNWSRDREWQWLDEEFRAWIPEQESREDCKARYANLKEEGYWSAGQVGALRRMFHALGMPMKTPTVEALKNAGQKVRKKAIEELSENPRNRSNW